jgi:hypothetical protein
MIDPSSQVEELFQSETGLNTFAVSPDSRLVVIITKSGTMLLLSLPDLELVAEEVLFDSSGGDQGDGHYSVQVNWRHDSRYFGLNLPNGKNGSLLIYLCTYGSIYFILSMMLYRSKTEILRRAWCAVLVN